MFIVCKDKNTTYKIGDAFVKDDCSEICECFGYKDDDDEDEDEDDEDDDAEDDEDDDEDDYHCFRPRRNIKKYQKSKIICSALCAGGSPCPAGLVDGKSCFCNRSRCEKRK